MVFFHVFLRISSDSSVCFFLTFVERLLGCISSFVLAFLSKSKKSFGGWVQYHMCFFFFRCFGSKFCWAVH